MKQERSDIIYIKQLLWHFGIGVSEKLNKQTKKTLEADYGSSGHH